MKCSGDYILQKLKNEYTINPRDYVAYDVWLKYKDCFKVLIATLLSQNSTDKGTYKAFYSLESKIGVNPDNLSNAHVEAIGEAIKSIGIYKIKSERIHEISLIIKEKYNGNLDEIIDLSPEEARKELMSLPGIGEKTADVVLLTCKNYPFFPVDTHIKRISKRLGIEGNSYDEISCALKRTFKEEDYLKAHHLLIAHGRNTCKAIKPLCLRCSISDCCEYFQRNVRPNLANTT
jgi:endonuclease-3